MKKKLKRRENIVKFGCHFYTEINQHFFNSAGKGDYRERKKMRKKRVGKKGWKEENILEKLNKRLVANLNSTFCKKAYKLED